MNRLCLGLALLLSIAVFGCTEKSAPTAPAAPSEQLPSPGPALSDSQVAAFVSLVNEHRVSIGLAPLRWDPRVAAVAQAHSQDMQDRSFFSHTNPDGLDPFERLTAAEIGYTYAGENIAYGYATASSVLAAWLNSPGHRANIENPNYTHHGVGLVNTYWTHVFIRPSATAAGSIARTGATATDPTPPPLRAP